MRAPYPPWDARKRDAYRVLEHVVGERLTSRLVGGPRQRVSRRQAEAVQGVEGALLPVPRVANQSVEAFLRDHLRAEQPVVLEGAAKHWPAMGWTPEFFSKRFGHETIRLLQMGPEDVGLDRYEARETTLAEALDHLEQGNRAYCRFLPTLMEHPELQEDLDMDWFSSRRGPLSPPGNFHLFIGGAGTETGTHTAVSANLFLQVHGRKQWKIYAPSWWPVFKPPMERAMYFSSAFDPDRPDYEAYPEARHLRGYEVELEAGDVLYNPPFWWHKVRNPTVSIGLGFRWFPLGPCFRASPTFWLLTYLSVNPPLWRGLQHDLDFTRIFTDRWFSR